jgi:hypothetical protein
MFLICLLVAAIHPRQAVMNRSPRHLAVNADAPSEAPNNR